MTLVKRFFLVVAFVIIAGTGLFEALQNVRLGNQIQMFRQQQAAFVEQIAQLRSDSESISNQRQASRSRPLSSQRLRELLRLRSEVGMLRRRQSDLEHAIAAAESKGFRPDREPTTLRPPSTVSPFQM